MKQLKPCDDVNVMLPIARSVFGAAALLRIERVREGTSTIVYRVFIGGDIFFMRILPEHGISFAPEVAIHALLYERGVRVPKVIFFAEQHPDVERSLMITTQIVGTPIGTTFQPIATKAILRQSGHDLAQIHSIPVHGFGFIDRSPRQSADIHGSFSTMEGWIQEDVLSNIPLLTREMVVSLQNAEHIMDIAHEVGQKQAFDASLAHGDFDCTHIFHENGTYTGIIDFGEIRGAHRWYDLGHFVIENELLLPALLEGYNVITPISETDRRDIYQMALLIVAHRVGRRIRQRVNPYTPDVVALQRLVRQMQAFE